MSDSLSAICRKRAALAPKSLYVGFAFSLSRQRKTNVGNFGGLVLPGQTCQEQEVGKPSLRFGIFFQEGQSRPVVGPGRGNI